MNETLITLGAIGGLLFLALIAGLVLLAIFCGIFGFVATRVGAELNSLEAMSGGRRKNNE